MISSGFSLDESPENAYNSKSSGSDSRGRKSKGCA